MRRTPALLSAIAAVALIAAALTGCTSTTRGPGNQPAGCTAALPSGDASSTVTASGSVGKTPKTSFPTPLVGSDSQVTVVKAGHGMVAQTGSQVDIEYTVYSGTTGKSIGGTGYDGTNTTALAAGVPISGQKSSVTQALVCAQAGSRIVLTSTAAASFGKGGLTQYGIADNAIAVIVIDVLTTYLAKANGVNLLPKDGMPDVVTAVDGQPGIVIQELDKPTTARSETVKAGSGAVLKATSKAVLLFTGFIWPTSGKPTVVTSLDLWSSRIAATVPMQSISAGGSLPASMVSALVGQKVGSQVLVVLPPKDAFPAGSEPDGVTASDTLVFVVDILGVAK